MIGNVDIMDISKKSMMGNRQKNMFMKISVGVAEV